MGGGLQLSWPTPGPRRREVFWACRRTDPNALVTRVIPGRASKTDRVSNSVQCLELPQPLLASTPSPLQLSSADATAFEVKCEIGESASASSAESGRKKKSGLSRGNAGVC